MNTGQKLKNNPHMIYECPICMSSNKNISLQISIKDIWESSYSVLHCNNCELYFLNEKPSLEELKKFYGGGYYSNSFINDVLKNKFRYARSISQYNYIKKTCGVIGETVLEIGAGDGVLLSLFKPNHSLYATEYNSKYKEKAKKIHRINFIEEEFNKINGKFDMIVMSHVLEHLLDFKGALTHANSLLNDGGYLFIELPNSPKPTEIKPNELQIYLNTEHIHNFNCKNLLMSIPNNFELIKINRFSYNILEKNKQKMFDISRTLLDSKIKLNTLFHTLITSSLVFIKPERFYKEVDINSGWNGWGDNIRLVLKKI